MKTLMIAENYNCFGDSVFTFLGEDYNFYQHNCSRGKDLIQQIKKQNAVVFLACCVETMNETYISFKPALPILEQMLAVDQEVASYDHSFDFTGAGAEIVSSYGY